MAEVLSQSEMESLLATGNRSVATAGRSNSMPISPQVIASLRRLHELFADETAGLLSELLRLPVGVQLTLVDQLSFGELASGLESPTSLHVLQVEPLAGSWLLELNCPIAFPIVDRLLGGGGGGAPEVPRRPLTDIESRVLSRAVDRIAESLCRAWAGVCKLNLRPVRHGSGPQQVSFVGPDEPVILFSFDVALGGGEGKLNLCLPCRTLESVDARLLAAARALTEADEEKRRLAGRTARADGVEIVVQLASTRLTVDEVANLAVGDVIVTECDQNRPLAVTVDGERRFSGFAGLVKGRKAVRIDAPLPESTAPHAPSSTADQPSHRSLRNRPEERPERDEVGPL